MNQEFKDMFDQNRAGDQQPAKRAPYLSKDAYQPKAAN